MPPRERIRAIGLQRTRQLIESIGREVRHLRRAAGITQATLAAASGVSRQYVWRLELGRLKVLDLALLAGIYTALGHRLSVKGYPVGEPVRDKPQLRLLERFGLRMSSIWRRTREAVMPIPGDLRAWDLRLDGPVSIGVDAETVLDAVESKQRAMAAKQRDSRVERTILLVADTRHNREVLRAHRAALREMFPLTTREVLAALEAGRDPGGNGIVVL